jgi:putative Mg2+ transporter-C (MgtC) family protein
LRLALTFVCAGILGFDRDEHGRSAGLRTNLLVGLAACLAMLQANLLIASTGKTPDSFIVMDTMRLPLGILSGIGFIGGGAILKRGELVVGVTTAATIWFVTVMGLCFGGGQLAIGMAGFALGFVVLNGLKHIELRFPTRHRGTLKVTVVPDGPSQTEIAALLNRNGVTLKEPTFSVQSMPDVSRVYGWKIEWKGKREDTSLPGTVQALSANRAVQKMELVR